jgi:hypothetical protein
LQAKQAGAEAASEKAESVHSDVNEVVKQMLAKRSEERERSASQNSGGSALIVASKPDEQKSLSASSQRSHPLIPAKTSQNQDEE